MASLEGELLLQLLIVILELIDRRPFVGEQLLALCGKPHAPFARLRRTAELAFDS